MASQTTALLIVTAMTLAGIPLGALLGQAIYNRCCGRS